MDPVRFDALTRSLGQVRGRRHLMALLTALPLVGVLNGMPGDDAEANRSRTRQQHLEAQSRRKRRNRGRKNKKNNRKNNNSNGNGNNQNQSPPTGATSPPPPLGSTQCGNNGDVCFQDSDCCTNNCFNFQCATRVLRCIQGGTTTNCRPPARGCAGLQCCYGAVSCNDGCCQGPANQCNAGGNCCAPNCAGRQCGDDGCGAGGTCGSCPSNQTCTADGRCQGSCVPQCRGKQCGPDGCGGSCGTCPTGSTCNDGSGQCLCTPDCTGKQCGSNGCGGSCGVCGVGQICTATGQCQNDCNPQTCPSGCCDELGRCQSGRAELACGTGGVSCNRCNFNEGCCGGVCIDVQDNPTNCGACGNVCPRSTSICEEGICCVAIAGPGSACSVAEPCCGRNICSNGNCCAPSGSGCEFDNECCSGVCGNGGCT